MGLFTQLCRNLGLMVHNVKHEMAEPQKRVVSKTVEEKKVNESTTLRRIVIEEVEVKREAP